eukprot:1154528-Pelagomonas_calceolata.AAC.3
MAGALAQGHHLSFLGALSPTSVDFCSCPAYPLTAPKQCTPSYSRAASKHRIAPPNADFPARFNALGIKTAEGAL